jgi:hypothetical protein
VATQAWSRAFGAFVKRRERAADSLAEFSFHWLSVAVGVIGGHPCRFHAIRSRGVRGYSEPHKFIQRSNQSSALLSFLPSPSTSRSASLNLEPEIE